MEKEIKNWAKKGLRCRKMEHWWPELYVNPFMSHDWPMLLFQQKQWRWGGPILPLPHCSVHTPLTGWITNSMCVWGRATNRHNFTYNSCLQRVSLRPSSPLLSLLSVNHYHHYWGTDFTVSLFRAATATHWQKSRQTTIHPPCPKGEDLG